MNQSLKFAIYKKRTKNTFHKNTASQHPKAALLLFSHEKKRNNFFKGGLLSLRINLHGA